MRFILLAIVAAFSPGVVSQSIADLLHPDQHAMSTFKESALDPDVWIFEAATSEKYPNDELAEKARMAWLKRYMTISAACPDNFSIHTRVELEGITRTRETGLMYTVGCPEGTNLKAGMENIEGIFAAKKEGSIEKQLEFYNLNYFSISKDSLFEIIEKYQNDRGKFISYELVSHNLVKIGEQQDQIAPILLYLVRYEQGEMIEKFTIENQGENLIARFAASRPSKNPSHQSKQAWTR